MNAKKAITANLFSSCAFAPAFDKIKFTYLSL